MNKKFISTSILAWNTCKHMCQRTKFLNNRAKRKFITNNKCYYCQCLQYLHVFVILSSLFLFLFSYCLKQGHWFFSSLNIQNVSLKRSFFFLSFLPLKKHSIALKTLNTVKGLLLFLCLFISVKVHMHFNFAVKQHWLILLIYQEYSWYRASQS